MTEADAQCWVADRFGSAAVDRLVEYEALLIEETAAQNLVAPSTIATMWARHFVDCAQLIDIAPKNGIWVDVGSGAGLPGIVVALLSEHTVILLEPRRLRAEFLARCSNILGLKAQVAIVPTKAQNAALEATADIISARAVARLDALFDATRHLSDRQTTYILPKGISAQSEVAMAKRSWHGTFHVKQSVIDPSSGIVVATDVARR